MILLLITGAFGGWCFFVYIAILSINYLKKRKQAKKQAIEDKNTEGKSKKTVASK